MSNNNTGLTASVPTLNDENLQKLNRPVMQNFTNQEISKERYDDLKSVQIKDKAYADIRVKIGAKKSPERYDQESIPSEISEDMWGEIPKLQAYQNAQILKKEKEDR